MKPAKFFGVRPTPSSETADSTGKRWGTVLLLLVVVATGVGVALIVQQEARATAELKARFHAEHRLRLESCLDHAQDYFDAVYSTLYFVSLDDEVMSLQEASRKHIQKVYDHQ